MVLPSLVWSSQFSDAIKIGAAIRQTAVDKIAAVCLFIFSFRKSKIPNTPIPIQIENA